VNGYAGARIALQAQGLAPTASALKIAERLSRGEIDRKQALSEVLQLHGVEAPLAAV